MMFGYGAIVVPRTFWRDANPAGMLERLEFSAPDVDTGYYDAKTEVEDAAFFAAEADKKLRAEAPNLVPEDAARLRFCMDVLLAEARLAELAPRRSVREGSAGERGLDGKGHVTEPALATLHRRMKLANAAYTTCKYQWEALLADTARLEMILNKSLPEPAKGSGVGPFFARAMWLYNVYYAPRVRKTLACFTAFLSVIIIWSEVTLLSPVNLSPIGLVLMCVRATSPAPASPFMCLLVVPPPPPPPPC